MDPYNGTSGLFPFLEIGDSVQVDNKMVHPAGWVDDLPPIGTVCGFSQIALSHGNHWKLPLGVYEDRRQPIINYGPRVEKETVVGTDIIPLKCADLTERRTQWYETHPDDMTPFFRWIDNLPETRFCVGDYVRLKRSIQGRVFHAENGYVANVYYPLLGQKTHYAIAFENGGSTQCDDLLLTLIQRGNIWKHENDQPLEFTSLHEEASFYINMNMATFVMNSATGEETWSLADALHVIKNGFGHGIYIRKSSNHDDMNICVIHCNDETVGKRLRADTLNLDT